jgi:hypothetical protein
MHGDAVADLDRQVQDAWTWSVLPARPNDGIFVHDHHSGFVYPWNDLLYETVNRISIRRMIYPSLDPQFVNS